VREEAGHLTSIHGSRAEGTYRYFIEDCERESEVSAGYDNRFLVKRKGQK
jgi:hypothetical protein